MSKTNLSKRELIDLRSDTVTKPTPAMRDAMASAEVGDDVYGEDPTVNRLEERAAELAGKEAALFVPTGTMGNTIALKLHTSHGEEIICDARSHIVDWELSMMAWFTGCLARTIPAEAGLLRWSDVESVLRRGSGYSAPTTLVSLENTHNMSGGTIYELPAIDEICDCAHEQGLKVHIDGARIFNAATASGVPVSRLVERADSVMFCLSKALGAPVGSMLAGTRKDMEQARLYRKRLGGGMRQAGVLAAAGLLALEEGPAQLPEDHRNARYLAEQLAELPGIRIQPDAVCTNIIIFNIAELGVTAPEFSEKLKEQGIIANGINKTHVRFVTHRDVSRAQCEEAMRLTSGIVNSLQSVAAAV